MADPVFAPQLPLHGLRVLDITVVWAGPHCTQLLAEWGAEVIRLEPLSPPQPNTRGAENRVTKEQVLAARAGGGIYLYGFPDFDPGERPWNRSPAFNSHARNKRSMTVNVATPEGREVFLDMVRAADVVVENNVPETVERAGFTYADLAVANPAIILLRMPAYGLSGPYKNYRSFGTHMEGMTGHHYLRSYPNLDPSMVNDAFTVDAASGVVGAFAVMAALRHRRRTGEGQLIELAQAENFLSYLGEYVLDYTMNGRSPEPQGNHHPCHSPHGVYPCRYRPAFPDRPDERPEEGGDRWIAIDVATDAEWQRLVAVMGEPEWTGDPRFATTLGRWQHRDKLNEQLSGWTRTQDDRELFLRLQEAGVTAGPVQNERDAHACPQLLSRGFFETMSHPQVGTHTYPGLNIRMAGTPNHAGRRFPCLLGQDNDYVYHDLLGVEQAKYDRLVELGQIGEDYPPPPVR